MKFSPDLNLISNITFQSLKYSEN